VIIHLPLGLHAQTASWDPIQNAPAYSLAWHHKLALPLVKARKPTYELTVGVRPPVYFLILAPLFKIFGVYRWVALILSLIPAALYFCIVYIMARWLTSDRWSALFSALLLSFGETGVVMAKAHSWDALSAMFFAFSLLIFLLTRRYSAVPRKIFLVISGILLSLATQTYAVYFLMFFSFIVYLFFEEKSDSAHRIQEILLFSFAFVIPFVIWFHFIEDIHTFAENILGFIIKEKIVASSASRYPGDNWFVVRLKEVYRNYGSFTFGTTILLIAGSLFLIRKFLQYKRLYVIFVLLPALLIFLSSLCAPQYFVLTAPLLFIGAGAFVAYLFSLVFNNTLENRKKRIFIAIFTVILIGWHIIPGIVARYAMLIKDWRIRDFAAYERELLRWIPPGSRVVGLGENWYALTRTGSTMYMLDSSDDSVLDVNQLDYVVVPTIEYFLSFSGFVSSFVKEHCVEIARIGKGAYNYRVTPWDSCSSGLSSIIYKVKK